MRNQQTIQLPGLPGMQPLELPAPAPLPPPPPLVSPVKFLADTGRVFKEIGETIVENFGDFKETAKQLAAKGQRFADEKEAEMGW